VKPSPLHALTAFGILFLQQPATADDSPRVDVKVYDKSIEFRSGPELVARYHFGADAAKPYVWPIHAPGNRALTRSWPMEKALPGGSIDHVHQKSAWFCHGDVIPEGIEPRQKVKGVEGIDFWSEGRGHGRIVCTQVGEQRREKNRVRIDTHNEWRSAEGTKILDEDRVIQLVDCGDARLFIFDIDLCASAVPITFGDTKEGSFGVRINDQIREQTRNGKIENADGKVGERNCWGQLSAWCDYSGMIDGATVGLAILDDPGNPYRACWHSRAYGLMAANPFGRTRSGFPAMKGRTDLVKLAKGEHLKLRYGLLIHPGDAKEGKVAAYYDRFVKMRE